MAKARQDFQVYVTNLSEMPVNLPHCYAGGILELRDGSVKELPQGDEQPHGEVADRVGELSPAPAATGARERPPMGQDPAEEQWANPAKEPDKEGAPPMPRVEHELIPDALYKAVEAFLEQENYLCAGQLRKLDISHHRIQV